MKITPVILSGGVGSRLWPLSRTALPKQFHPLGGENAMFVETINRVTDDRFKDPVIVSNYDHRFLVAEALRQAGIEKSDILLEPVVRNTAPALVCAAYALVQKDPEAVMLILPCDHLIRDVESFYEALDYGMAAVNQGKLVTFAMTPSKPETGYGYIHSGDPVEGCENVFGVSQFVEKPDLETAQKYLAAGTYYWNSGMFLLSAKSLLEELDRFEPELVQSCRKAVDDSAADLSFTILSKDAFMQCKDISIDYALWERTTNAASVPTNCGWSDIGSWASLYEISDADDQGNVLDGNVINIDTTNCYVRSDGALVGTCGVDNLAVIATTDAVLIMDKDKSQDVKKIVSAIKKKKLPHVDEQPRMYRPWGWYETMDEGERFKVKHIYVKPGGCLSLQKHHHRAEHWIVVKGSATVTRNGEEKLLTENESIYVSIGDTHRLENKGVIPLRLIEVQTGSYLGEDDIVRLEDIYKRNETQ